jgi:stalled ribosome alternative rescue factor ArfA
LGVASTLAQGGARRPIMVKNPVAKALSSGVCRPQVIRPKKGKGSYSRKSLPTVRG